MITSKDDSDDKVDAIIRASIEKDRKKLPISLANILRIDSIDSSPGRVVTSTIVLLVDVDLTNIKEVKAG